MIEARIQGAEQLGKVAAALKGADKEIRRESNRALREVTKPLQQEVQANLLTSLPKRGGMAGQVHAETKTAIRRRASGIRIESKGRNRQLRRMDREGAFRHPLFGNRGHWFSQSVPKGWFTEPIERRIPEIRERLVQVLDGIARKIGR